MREKGSLPLHIKEFDPKRELLYFGAATGVVILGVARGFWDLVAVAAMVYVLMLSNLLRRVEWRGQALTPTTLGPSVFTDGWQAIRRDIVTLCLILVVFPTTAVVFVLVFGDLVAWIGLATSGAIAVCAAIALTLELRRRRAREK